MTKQKGICEECACEYEYEYNPKYPRKFCFKCSAAKKQAYEESQKAGVPNELIPAEKPDKFGEAFPVEKPGDKYVKDYGVPDQEVKTKFTANLKAYPKDPVGLAVEIFCAVINEKNLTPSPVSGMVVPTSVMDTAIKLVKQAQEAFS